MTHDSERTFGSALVREKAIDRRLDFEHLVSGHRSAEQKGGTLHPFTMAELVFVQSAIDETRNEYPASVSCEALDPSGRFERVGIGDDDKVGADFPGGKEKPSGAIDFGEGTHSTA